ncbi:MAG: hypothetical protein A2934_05290 [Candidatus Sungbacteria bacterium RIFCSPLOWO2_01_FULL_47_10]|uniref:Uncharacterized protein n=1 Tax=Candidatus Sungbacteria bacterium RIFCSPLOWO2_01_FULL_47_10 TaxID=1802276 RepID=A0A1G2L4T5_9BACT|nr:MAG: hypothetical protein A2934_05290 [Candidatus Sungbacteria bacterium RIFCSPLOWO2_01_FULL_47_10]
MKFLKRVKTIEVKRCFVGSQYIRGGSDKRRVPTFERNEFIKKQNQARKYVKRLSEKQLDRIIATEFKKRLMAYNDCDWHIGTINVNEVGVWKGAGGLPVYWTADSLKKTAVKVAWALSRPEKHRIRALKAIPRILKTSLDLLEQDPYSLPIVLPGGIGTAGRKGLKKMKGDIDDGCIRAIALAISGKKNLKAYIGSVRHSV